LQSQQSLLGPVAQQQLLQARANAHNAANDFVRQQSLFAKGFIGQARLDEAERAKQVADSQVTAAESQATANINGSEMKQTIARVAEARAAVAFATSRLQQARIVAPSEGMVLERLAEPGQIVQPGTKLLSLSLAGPTQLVAQVDEKFLAQLKVGQNASVVADAYPGQKFAATIQRIAPTIDTQRGSVEVKFAVATAPTFLRNDMTLSIEVETARRDKVIVLPAEYVSGGSTPQVMVIENNRASIRPVKLGVRSTTLVEVLDGLREGESVIADAKIPVGARVSVGDEIRAKKLLPANINAAATEGMKAFADR
jgi:HlyD family secretion protein